MSFDQALSGLNAASQQLDVIGNNVANASTVGFKGSTAEFAALYANTVSASSVGLGTTVAAVEGNFSQGAITTTTNPLDVAINGPGFFRLDTNGSLTYSRNGQFQLDNNGYIVNATGAKLTGYGVGPTGAVVSGTPAPLQISTTALAATPTSKAAMVLNLDAGAAVIPGTFSVSDPATYNNTTSMTVYDSLGNAHVESAYFVKTAANAWTVYGSLDGAAGTSLGTLNFNTDGTLNTATSAVPFAVSNTLANGATTPFALTLDFTNSTQFGSAFNTTSETQNGNSSGALSGFNISNDGTLVGTYSNGQTLTLGQVVLANFASVQGLQPLSGNGYAQTSASGQPLLGVAGSGSFGALQSGAVEESNVDLTQQLVDLITAQRVYQANAQTIKTQDQVLNTLVNLQ